MKIWFINHYAVPPRYYPLARPSLFAKNLIKMGHTVTIIAASTVHNSNKNLIEEKTKVKQFIDDGISYILIKCSNYKGNGIKRIINILQFSTKLPKILKKLDKPDVIVATSFDPLSCYAGIKYAKKNGIKAIAEIADLWPETLVAYAGLTSKNLIVKYLRGIEKKIYTKADRIIFTMEGAYDYIIEQGWEKCIPRNKVAFINNGIDLEQFNYNRNHFNIDDVDLRNNDIFKIIYTGAIRKVNNLRKLIDIAMLIKTSTVKFLIWGDGDQLDELKEYINQNNVSNVVLKGKIEKKYIPYITSQADLNIVHNEETPIMRFGISMNKIFDYLAAGKPILIDFVSPYNPVIENNAGIQPKSSDIRSIAETIENFANEDVNKRQLLGNVAKEAAQLYDFSLLTKKLVDVIMSI